MRRRLGSFDLFRFQNQIFGVFRCLVRIGVGLCLRFLHRLWLRFHHLLNREGGYVKVCRGGTLTRCGIRVELLMIRISGRFSIV